jgi:hypothetical protein
MPSDDWTTNTFYSIDDAADTTTLQYVTPMPPFAPPQPSGENVPQHKKKKLKKKAKVVQKVTCTGCCITLPVNKKEHYHFKVEEYSDYTFCKDCWSKAKKCSCCGYKTPAILIAHPTNSYKKFKEKYKVACLHCYDKYQYEHPPEYVKKCLHCNVEFASSTSPYSLGHGDNLCPTCKVKLMGCDCCGQDVYTDYTVYDVKGNKQRWCANCYVAKEVGIQHCAVCHHHIYDTTPHIVSPKGVICNPCKKKHPVVKLCKWCGVKLGKKGLDGYCNKCKEYSNTRYCYVCQEDRNAVENGACQICTSKKQGVLKEAHWKYSPTKLWLHGRNKDNLYFGIENEVFIDTVNHTKDKVLASIMSLSDHKRFYAKYDGSIGGIPYGNEGHGDFGFELVSYPHTFEAMKEYDWSVLFNENTLLDETCGMHIHMTKMAFTTFHLFKFLRFITTKPKFITTIAERHLNDYSKPLLEQDLAKDSKIKWKEKNDQNRKVAVNLTNKDTVELRFFANVNTVEGLWKNVEFAHALFYFTRNSGAKSTTNVVNFKKFVRKHQAQYPHLAKFMGVFVENKRKERI